MRAVDTSPCDLSYGAIRRNVRKARKPIRQRCRRTCPQQSVRTPKNRERLRQRSRIVSEAESVHGSLIGKQFSPPESRLYPHARNVTKLVFGGLGGTGREDMSVVEIERRRRHVPRRPSNFAPPVSGQVLQMRIGRVPLLHINRERRLLHDPRVAAF